MPTANCCFYARTPTTRAAPGEVALERAARPHSGGGARVYRVGWFLPALSAASARACADIRGRLQGQRRKAGNGADGVCRSRGARGEGVVGPPVARHGGIRGERFPREQFYRLGVGLDRKSTRLN